MREEQVLHGPGVVQADDRHPPDRPYRRFDPVALESAERLILRGQHGLCGIIAVGILLALRGDMAVLSPQDRLWWGLFPLCAAALPVMTDRRGPPGLGPVLALIRALLHTAVLVVALQALLWMAGLPLKDPEFLAALFALHVGLCQGARLVLGRATRAWDRKTRVVVLGATAQGKALVEHLRVHAAADVDVIGFIDERSTRIEPATLPAPLLGTSLALVQRAGQIDAVVLALPNDARERIDALAAALRPMAGQVYLAPEEAVLHHALACPAPRGPGRVVALGLESLPLHGRILKRLLDIAVASIALLLFLPFGLLIALLIKLESPGPVIFRQQRFGRGNRLFNVYKFRSMRFDPVALRGEIRLTERGDARVTRLGDFLRRTSLDEFPQFANVLMGHMSVVGPRPHPPGVKAGDRIYEEVVRDFVERYKVRPGITGWAQVNGLRGNTFTEQHLTDRFDRDVEYIRHWSLELDLWIILKTFWGGFGGRNAF